jgi:hypothetical protein
MKQLVSRFAAAVPRSPLVRSITFERRSVISNWVAEMYPVQSSWLPAAYGCLLASSTKWPLKSVESIVPMPPRNTGARPKGRAFTVRTVESCLQCSLCWHIDGKVVVPPIMVHDGVFARAEFNVPILPSTLHPALDTKVINKLHSDHLERGRVFEDVFGAALHARYLLALWSAPQGARPGWVPLTTVLQGALTAGGAMKLQEYEVNLSAGVLPPDVGAQDGTGAAKANALVHMALKNPTSFHDFYMWCRNKRSSPTSDGFAVPLQLRHGHAKSAGAMSRQLFTRKERDVELPVPLLSVRQVLDTKEQQGIVKVNADALSSISWLWPNGS